MNAIEAVLLLREARERHDRCPSASPEFPELEAEIQRLEAVVRSLLDQPLEDLVAEGWRLAPGDDPKLVYLCHPHAPRMRRPRSIAPERQASDASSK